MRISTWTWGMALGALVVGVLATAPANAATLSVNGWVLGEQISVRSNGRTASVRAAELDVTVLGERGFSYCVDLAQSIGVGGSSGWTIMDADINPNVLEAAWLVEYARPRFNLLMGETPGATRATLITALQISIWEVLADTSSYDLYSGSFAMGAGTSANVMNLARGFLGALGGADLEAYQTSALWATHGSRQDQVVFNPIPEPSSIALFAAGLGLIAYAGRRKVA